MSIANVGVAWGTAYTPSTDEVIILNSVYDGSKTGYSKHSAIAWAAEGASTNSKKAGDPNNGGAATSSNVNCYSVKGNGGAKNITVSITGCSKIIVYHESHGTNYVRLHSEDKDGTVLGSGSASTYYTELTLTPATTYTIFLEGWTGSAQTDFYVYAVKLIKGEVCDKTAPTASWSTAPANGAEGGNMNATLTTNYATGAVYTSSNTSVATVSGNGTTTCAINYVGAGSARITATVTGDGSTYCTGPATCYTDITVTSDLLYAYGFEDSPSAWDGSNTSNRANNSTAKRTGSVGAYADFSNGDGRLIKGGSIDVVKDETYTMMCWIRMSVAGKAGIGYDAAGGKDFDVSASTWTRVYKEFTAGSAKSGKKLQPTISSSSSGNMYVDDIVMYKGTVDVTAPSSASSASATTSSISWTNGSDANTGLQKTLIWHRTSGSSDDLTLNAQGIYSLTSTIGPSADQSGHWTLLSASVAHDATSYSGTFVEGDRYAIVHRDLAYNYSTPTYVTVSAAPSCTAPNHVDISGTWHLWAGGSMTLSATAYSSEGTESPIDEEDIYSYQWYKGGTEEGNKIVGATSKTYTKSGCDFNDAGYYYCKVNTGADCGTMSGNYAVRMLRIYVRTGKESGGDYGTIDCIDLNNGNYEAQGTIRLASGSYTYGFGISDGCNNWSYNSSTMTSSNCTDWNMDKSGGTSSCGLTSTNFGIYTFTLKYGNLYDSGTYGGYYKVSVNYPATDQAAGKIIYFDNSTVNWSNLHWRIGQTGNTVASAMSLVPGTANLYKVSTSYYGSLTAWHIANQAGWTGNTNSIYKTKTGDGYAITKAIEFDGGAVTDAAITIIPKTTPDPYKGGDDQNNNCDFHYYDYKKFLWTHTATISATTNGSIRLNWTDISDAAQTATSTTSGLAHTCNLRVTAEPATGYDVATLTVNGSNFTSGDTHVLSADATIAATFSLHNYNVTYSAPGNGNNYTIKVADGSATSTSKKATMGQTITIVASPAAGYDFTGWTITKAGGAGTVTPADASATTTTFTMPTSDVTITASFTLKTYTITAAVNNGDYGSVSPASITVNHGSTISISDNVLTCNGNTLTATATTSTAQYTYAFDNWTGVTHGATVTSNLTATANFTRTLNNYSVSATLTNCAVKGGSTAIPATMDYGADLSTTIEAETDYVLPSTISVSGVTSYTWNQATGALTLTDVTGNVSISIVAEEEGGGGDCVYSVIAEAVLSGTTTTSTLTGGTLLAEGLNGSGPYKLKSTPSWFGMKLSNNLQVGDSIIFKVKVGDWWAGASASSVPIVVFAGKSLDKEIYRTSAIAKATDNYYVRFKVTQTMIDSYGLTDTVMIWRTKTNDPSCTECCTQNHQMYSMQVKHCTPSCTIPAAPTSPTNGATTSNSQAVSWTDGSNDKWDVYVSTSSSTPAAGVTSTASGLTAKTYTFTGLTASTEYYWWVRSVCDDTHKSSWVDGSAFETSAAPTLYTVTFESNGGSDVSPIEQASEDASITMPAAPTYSGYTFQGWVIGGTTYAAGASYTPTANVTAYASWKGTCAGGGGGSTTTTLSWFDTSQGNRSSSNYPSSLAKWLYGYSNSAKSSAYAYTITTANTNNKGQGTGDSDYLRFDNGSSIYIYADNTTTSGTPASFNDVTAVSLKIKLTKDAGTSATIDIKVGSTTIADDVDLSEASTSSFKLYEFEADNLDGTIQIIHNKSGDSKYNLYIDDIAITTAGGGATCHYVTYDGNGADGGSVSDKTAYTSGTNVTVLGNVDSPAAFTKTDYRFNGWNTAANGSGTSYAAGDKINNIRANVTLYAQWVADACSAPSAPTISGTSVRTVGQTIELTAFCESGKDARTTYTWYKGDTWDAASATTPVQAAMTIEEGGRIFNKASCVAGDAGTYWCEASNGPGCASHNATGFAVAVNDAAGDEHIYYYKDANHYSDGVYSNPEGNAATLKDNQALSSPWTICNACMTGVDSVVAHGATYDGKGNHMNAYIKLPTGGDATTKNIKFALTAGYTGTLKIKIGGYENNPTVTLQPLNTSTGVLGDAISYSGTVSGVATTEDNFGEITWNLTTPGGTYVLTVTSKTGYISQIDMTTSTSTTFNVTYNGNDNTGGTVPTDATNYASGATVTAAANSGGLVKTNYTGAGWNTANNGTGTNYVPGTGTFSITANTTLYAHWTQLITLAPGAQGTGTNNAAVSWNGSVLRGFAAHTASGYALQGYYTEPSGGTKVLNADGSFAATNIDGFVTSGKWSNTGAAPTLYAQWEASNLLKWNLKVNVSETSITTLSKESAAPTVIAVANMGNLTNNGSLTITGSAKSGLTSKIATTTSATDGDAGKYMSVQFIVAAGYQLVPSDIKVKVQPISHSQTAKLILEDNHSQSISYTSGSLSTGSTHTVTMTNSEEVAFTGTVKLKIYVYGTAESDGYRLGTPIEINGSVEETCTPPTFSGISYSATEYTVGASASAISVTGATNVGTYLWKQNDVNDRSGGTAASGENDAASYTPSTSTKGTKYYWCEMTNGCTTVKTAAVGITVRNATTDPTVTWSNVKLGATDDVTPNYGGGNYVLRATVNETSWPGTLAASMITAPAGITIHDVTTGKADNKNYIEFQFDVTTAFDRASNATIDFNLALPEVGSYSALNSVKSVDYNDCSGGAAGQVAIKMGATASTSKSNPQNYWETAGAGRLMYNYGGNMGSTNNPSGYKTADSTFNYYAASTGQKWMFQTYIAGVNKVRVAFRAAGTIKSSKATITNFYYNTEYFASPGSNAVSFGEVSASKAGYSSGEDGYIEFTVPEMAANSYGAFVTADGNMKVYGVVLYSENAGGGGSVPTNPVWSGGLANEGTVSKTQSDANFTYTISTTTNTLGAISYSSSNPSCAAVDPVTGEVTITATGASAQNATITATLARSGCYQGATRTYTINVAGYSCSEPSGSIELTSGSATKCASESVTLTMTGFTEGASIQWYNGESTISSGGGYTITTTATQSTLTTTAAGTYSAIATSSCVAKRTNSITIANLDMSEQKTVRKVSQWYVKNGRPTPDIALWQLGEGETFKSVEWSPANATGLDFRTDTETGIVYLEGKEPSANTSGDIEYTLTLTITDACGTDHALSGQTIKLTHQKNTDKHVLAFVVGNTEKNNNKYVAIGKGFTESITASQTTQVSLYNAIAAQFDVQATNIYSTDDEQKLREYYSQYDILCITDYPNTLTKGANSKSYVDAIGALIDIRPILTMEAFVSALPNWKLKGVSGNPKSPSTRQYTMLLQCKDHEIFSGTKLTKVGEGDEAMYRVTMVDKNQEEYKTLDANYGDGEHKANEGYQYGKKPALQGFTYTEEMSDNNMLPLGLIDDGAGNDLQVGIERQAVMEARMMVLGINSYAMERLDKDGQTIVINALKYLMKKSAEDISDCSVYFDGSDETDPTNWDNELNWGPSYASLPLPHQEVRILKECVVKDGVVARASGIKIIPRGRINHDTDDASGSLTIEPGGALIVDGKVRAAVAPNYFNATPTTPANLAILASADAQGALILDNSEGETQATVQMYSKATTSANTCWQYIGIPMESLRPAQNWFYNAWMMKYTTGTQTGDEALYSWEYIKTYDELNSFNGYALTQEEAKSYWLAGALAETGVRELPLSNAGGNGWNLYANSWTAPINIAAIESSDFVNADATIYLYNTGSRADWDAVSGDAVSMETTAAVNTAGQYLSVPVGLAEYVGAATQIPAMQGFFVQGNHASAAGSLTLDYDKVVRTTPTEKMTTPLRAPRRAAASKTEPEHLTMIVQGSSYGDVLHLFRSDEWTDAYDNGYDAHKVYGDDYTPQLAAGSPEEELAVVATDELEGTQIRFRAGTHDSEYTIRFLYNSEDESLYLYDIQEQTYTRVETGASYTFTASDKNVHTRFVLTRNAPQIATGVGEVPSDQVQGIKAKKLLIEDKMFIMVNGILYDATGKVVK